MRLIVLGDLHLTEFDDPALAEARDFFFEEFFRQVAAHKADLVIAVGDTVTYGFISELTRQNELAAKAGLNFLRIPGNHDAYKVPKKELAPFFLGDHPRASQTDLYTTFDAGPVRFLLLDTTREIDKNWSGFVKEEQLAWLDDQIAAYNEGGPPFLVVLGHHPITGTTHLSELLWYNIFNSPAVAEKFAKLTRPPAFYVCGHNHSNSVNGPDAQGWYYVQLGAPLLCYSYGLFTFDEEGKDVRFEKIDIDRSDPAFWKALDTSRLAQGGDFNERPPEAMYGEAGDHLLVVSR
jgi:DNA repair exonuclease SbcCD nuclease subunit